MIKIIYYSIWVIHMHILFFISIVSLSLSCMENPIRHQKQKSTKKIKIESRFLENNIDAYILKHLIESGSNSQLIKASFKNIRSFMSVNKAVRAFGTDEKIIHFVFAYTDKIDKIWIATELATLGARDFLKNANKKNVGEYTQAIKYAVMNPTATFCLKGLIACDDIGITFRGIPRITPLMIAVGYKNEEAVNILIAQAKRKGIFHEYLNMQCAAGTDTKDEWLATDNEYDFFCFEGFTALHIASAPINKISLSIMKKLLTEGTDPNAENKLTPLPLFSALFGKLDENEDFSRAKLLLDYGADREQILNCPTAKPSMQEIKFLKSYKTKIL